MNTVQYKSELMGKQVLDLLPIMTCKNGSKEAEIFPLCTEHVS